MQDRKSLALAWVLDILRPGSRVVRSERLTGGLTSIVHAITVERLGRREQLVLRRIVPAEKYREWAFSVVAKETAILAALERTSIPAPRVLASTNDVQQGGPAILMTRLPGRMLLMPRDRERWLLEMARMLHRIHMLEIDAPPFESWLDGEALTPPPDAERPDVWREAIALVRKQRVPSHTCFIHRDYQHFNLLWSRERLTGVVDWVEACNGPPEADVGHCRLNLAVLFSAEVADRFLEMYEAESGRRVDPWWDVQALLSYGPEWPRFIPVQVDGRAPIDGAGMTSQMERVLQGALRRLG